MTFKTLIRLAEPKTFSASFLPVFYGSALAFAHNGQFSLPYLILLLFGMALVQGATNMINDYYDHKRSADQAEKADEKALVSGEVSPDQLKRLIQLFVAAALSIGVYFAYGHSWWILAVMAAAIIVLFSYSAGPKPLCYTPFGEAAAGLTMGLGITVTVTFIQSGWFGPETILAALPTVDFISSLLLANNLSDWQEDLIAGRKTSVILLGSNRAAWLWVMLMAAMPALAVLLAFLGVYSLWTLAAILLAFPYGKLAVVLKAPKERQFKGLMMGTTTQIGLRYHLAAVIMLCFFS